MPNDTLYIYIDESGNFDFSPSGSKYFVLNSISTFTPFVGREKLAQLKYELLNIGQDIESFHATEDKQVVRNRVFEIIKGFGDFEIDSVIAEKRKANLSLYQDITVLPDNTGWAQFKKEKVEEKFYKQICETLLKYLIKRYLIHKKTKIRNIVVILDALLPRKKRSFVTKQIKVGMKAEFGIVPHVYFHQTKSDINCQISDYCCWAIGVKWERNEIRPYQEIKNKIKNEFDIFAKGTTTYY